MKILSVIALLLLGSCCDSEAPRVDDHYSFLDCCVLELAHVDVKSPDDSVAMQRCRRGGGVGHSEYQVCVEALGKYFTVTAENLSSQPLVLDLATAAFVAETGKRMPVYFYELGEVPPLDWTNANQPVSILPGEVRRFSVQPIEKSYWVAYGCREGAWYQEPLVPESLRHATAAETQRKVQELLDSQQAVHLELPIRFGSSSVVLDVAFRLADRWGPNPDDPKANLN